MHYKSTILRCRWFSRAFSRLAILNALVTFTPLLVYAADEEGIHISLITDEDGDDAILMESELISMHLLPWRQALINRFVFRPSGNDIVEATNSKIRMAGGGGLLMDCLWEQDWRFQELGYKSYEYTITKEGPDEAQVVFATDIRGWIGGDGSGIISKLLSNLTLKRTVTLKTGQPFFRFDFELINNDINAKRPSFWVHNCCTIKADGSDTVLRPTARGIDAIGGGADKYPAHTTSDFVTDFNQGWSAKINEARKEGIVYLMDFDSTQTLYNCGNTTEEWWYDGILVFNKTPWKGRVYILPVIGLGHIDYANEYFIVEAQSTRDNGKLVIDYNVTSSYEQVARVTINTEVVADLTTGSGQSSKLKPVTFEGISVQPTRGHLEFDLADNGPLQFNISAFVELPDGSSKQYDFQRLDMGSYKLKKNVTDNATPWRLLNRQIRNPKVPEPPPGIAINTTTFNVFGVFGFGTSRLGIKEAIATIPNSKLTVGYCVGSDPPASGLSDFPYDYERLFDCRVLVMGNMQDREIRRVGASVMLPWLQAGGGLVFTGGANAFTFELEQHAINDYYPLVPTDNAIHKGPLQLAAPSPEVKDHPIFKGVDLSSLPWMYYVQDLTLKNDPSIKVLMKVGGKPFIVEKKTGKQITVVVANNAFGIDKDFPGKTHVTQWKAWPTLYANILTYAGNP